MSANGRNRQLVVTADGANNQTAPCTLRRGGIVTLEGTFTATVTPERKDPNGNWVAVTDNTGTAVLFTKPGTYTLTPLDNWAQYRLNCKPGSFTSGTLTMIIEGR